MSIETSKTEKKKKYWKNIEYQKTSETGTESVACA